MKRFLFLMMALALLILPANAAAYVTPPNGHVWAAVYDYTQDAYAPQAALPGVALYLDGQAVSGEMPGVILGGRTLAPLRLLAEGLGADVEWVPDAAQVIVRRGNDVIHLTLGSPIAQVNGVDRPLPDGVPATTVAWEGQGYTMVPLRFFSETFGCRVGWDQAHYAATVDRGGALPGALDTPISPERYLIVLDAGHGGSSSGAYYEDTAEKDLNLSMTRKVRDILRSLGYRTLMTREGDVDVGLQKRADIANAANADIFVSIHCNAAPNYPNAQGLHVYHYPGSATGAALAQAIQTPACAFTGARDRGIASEDFAVVRETHMPAVLVETGFMTNSAELQRLRDDTYQTNMARGIAQGIIQYLNGRR